MSLGMSQRQPWFCVGDFNEIPGSSVVETVMESFGGVVRSCGLPTRWKGERCVDWAMANYPQNASVPWLLSTAISDHIPLAFDVVLTAGPLLRGTLQSGPSWVKPSGVPLDLWRQVVELCWSRHPCVDQLSQVLLSDRLDVQVEWDLFQQVLQESLRTAIETLRVHDGLHEDVAKQCDRMLAQRGVKGCMARFRREQLKGGVRQEIGSLNIRKRRHWLARLYEYRRLLRAVSEGLSESRQLELDNLRSKVTRRLGYVPSILQIEIEISHLSQEISSLEASAKRLRLATWKQAVIDDDKALGCWLRSKCVRNACFVQGSDSTSGACRLIHDYWSKFWHEAERDCPSVDARISALVRDLPGASEMTWSLPSGAQLYERARQSRGAAGVDSWSGSEIASLPVIVMDAFAALARRWVLAGAAPVQFSECRMVLLPKEGKVDVSLVTTVADLRPISVLSCWWRLWIGCVLRVPECVHWIQHFLPHEVAVGNDVSAEQCVYELVDEWTACQGGLVSLDYSKAFDRLHPVVSIAMLRHLGWPSGLVNVLAHVWSSQRRWIQFQSETFERPLAAPALPQGDPLGPLIMTLWVVSGANYVQRLANPGLGRVLSRFYIDDRSLVSSDPDALRDHVDLWLAWSNSVGLVENVNKMVVLGRSRQLMVRLDALFPGVVSSVATVLGVGIGFGTRKITAKEAARINSSIRIIRLLACIRLPFVRFMSAVRMFASSRISFGWISKSINLTDSKKMWSAVSSSSRRLRMASPWLRGVIWGGNMHPDCIFGVRLVGLLGRLRLQGPLRWTSTHGHPVACLHTWLLDRGWTLLRPFVWKCEASNDLLDLHDPAWDVRLLQHAARSGWRAWCLRQHALAKRHDSHCADLEPFASFSQIDVDQVRSWALSCLRPGLSRLVLLSVLSCCRAGREFLAVACGGVGTGGPGIIVLGPAVTARELNCCRLGLRIN